MTNGHNIHLFPSFSINLNIPQEDKIYLEVGNDTILDCQITFESKEGKVIVGDQSFIGGSH